MITVMQEITVQTPLGERRIEAHVRGSWAAHESVFDTVKVMP